jgi:hypothetical protein
MDTSTKAIVGVIALGAVAFFVGAAFPFLQFWICAGVFLVVLALVGAAAWDLFL